MNEFIKRDIQEDVEAVTPPKAVVIIGPRRCGKTTLLEKIIQDSPVLWINADAVAERRQLDLESTSDARNLLRLFPTIVIDEAQHIPEIGLKIKLLVDANIKQPNPSRIFVTGSCALELAYGVKESALGRIVERRMWPLSVHEIASRYGWGYVHLNLGQFMVYGTLPEAVNNPEQARGLLTAYSDSVLFKDLFRLSEVRKHNIFVNLLHHLAYRIGSEINYESLGQEVGLNRETIQRYISQLERCHLICVVPSYARNLDNELKKGKKVYFTDLGIRNGLINDFRPFSTRDDAGALWENFFYMERLKLHERQRDFVKMHFWRTKGHASHELDFLEVTDGKMQAFECKLSPKAVAKPGTDFLKTYPDCKITVVTPQNALEYLGLP